LGKPMAVELDCLILRDMTSDELMDGWLADLGEKLDSCSDCAHQSSPPSPTASAAGVRLPLLLPSTMADDSIAASRTLSRTRASSTTGGRAAIWTSTALSRDSSSTVVRHTVVPREVHESEINTRLITNDHRASLWELEDTGMHGVDDVPTPKMDVSFNVDQPFIASQTETGHTFYTSEDSDLVAHVNSRARERRDTEPASSRNIVPRGRARNGQESDHKMPVP
ncbi:hypothetical protein LTR22_028075, partial [Elasticomyces elasticus]